jgi:superfamily II DNA or RNA helicase
MRKNIFGRVWDWWQRTNPEQRPSILFAPGVAESIWFAEQFMARGIPWAHIDGQNVWLDGQLRPTSRSLRDEVIGRLKDGSIKGVSNRFVLREGLDIPEASHGILATVMGSLQSYLQSGGRFLRSIPGKSLATIQDHGGMYHRLGSLNADRQWALDLTENVISGVRQQRFREKKEPEPIRCPQCSLIRSSGPVCPQCGYQCQRRSRMVVQQDGTLKEYVGDMYHPRVTRFCDNTVKLWIKCYYQAKNSRKRMTFNQAMAWFYQQNRYYPPKDLPRMPVDPCDWHLPVADVPPDRLKRT